MGFTREVMRPGMMPDNVPMTTISNSERPIQAGLNNRETCSVVSS